VPGCERLAVVITPSLLTELERNAREGRSLIRDRVRERKAWLMKQRDRTLALSEGATLIFQTTPHGMDLPARGLDPRSGDHQMIAEVLASQERHPGQRHFLVTADAPLLVIAPGFGVATIEPPADLETPIEDNVEKENRRLREELARLKSQAPRLSLEFEGGESALEVVLSDPPAPSEAEVLERIESARKALDPIFFTAPHAARASEFLEALGSYLRGGYLNDPITVGLPIELHNRGRAPAERIRVAIFAPPGLFVTPYETHHTREPKPPTHPVSELGRRALESLMPRYESPPFERRNPEIEYEKEHTRLSHEFARLDHHLHLSLRLFAEFESRAKAKSFRINYDMTSASVPDRIRDSLHVRFKKSYPEARRLS
jgi:hypothetical protein